MADYLKNNHIGVHIVFRMVIHARTAERGIEIERTGAGALAEDELWRVHGCGLHSLHEGRT